jgi:hypothetical protein
MSYVLPAGVKSAAAFGGLPGRNPSIAPPLLNGNNNVLPSPAALPAPDAATTPPPVMTPPHIMAAPEPDAGTGPGMPSAAPGTQNFIGDMPPPSATPGPGPTGQLPPNASPQALAHVPGLQGVQGGVVNSIATALQGGDPSRGHGHRFGFDNRQADRFNRFLGGDRFAALTPEQQATVRATSPQIGFAGLHPTFNPMQMFMHRQRGGNV